MKKIAKEEKDSKKNIDSQNLTIQSPVFWQLKKPKRNQKIT